MGKADSGMGNVQDARREMTKTKEQLEEEKKISLSIRIKPLELDGMDSDGLKAKASELWEVIVKLETEKIRSGRKTEEAGLRFERIERKAKTAEQTEGYQAWSGPRGPHRKIPTQNPHVLQV